MGQAFCSSYRTETLGSASAAAEGRGSPTQRRGAGSRAAPGRPEGGTADRARLCARLRPLAPRGSGDRVRRSGPHPASATPRAPSSGQRHTWVPPAPRPACAVHLDTERLQGQGLPGWTWRSRHWALRGIWGFRGVRLPPGGGGETPAKSRDSGRIPCVFEYSAHLDMFRSQKTTVMQAARRVSNLKNRKAEQVEKDLGGQVATC
ncbi:uncharacterized protein LOC109493902 [Felis catus]|uniref:uncharacterized protein LOC109493902 n=1 Tax=Felis catus TaxID=9685 RepID=UPI001D19B432|nr:uncharacterized protein LOC109493902 [Felis catus]